MLPPKQTNRFRDGVMPTPPINKVSRFCKNYPRFFAKYEQKHKLVTLEGKLFIAIILNYMVNCANIYNNILK